MLSVDIMMNMFAFIVGVVTLIYIITDGPPGPLAGA